MKRGRAGLAPCAHGRVLELHLVAWFGRREASLEARSSLARRLLREKKRENRLFLWERKQKNAASPSTLLAVLAHERAVATREFARERLSRDSIRGCFPFFGKARASSADSRRKKTPQIETAPLRRPRVSGRRSGKRWARAPRRARRRGGRWRRRLRPARPDGGDSRFV